MLDRDGWSIVAYVLGQPIGIIMEDHAVQQKHSRRVKSSTVPQQILQFRQ
jgi:hypothetical protein